MGGGSAFGAADHNADGLDVNGQVSAGLQAGAHYVLSSLYNGFSNTVSYGLFGNYGWLPGRVERHQVHRDRARRYFVRRAEEWLGRVRSV